LFAYGPADATIPEPHHLLPYLKPDWFYLSDISYPCCPGKAVVVAAAAGVVCDRVGHAPFFETQPTEISNSTHHQHLTIKWVHLNDLFYVC